MFIDPSLQTKPFELFTAAQDAARLHELDKERYGRPHNNSNNYSRKYPARSYGRPIAQSASAKSEENTPHPREAPSQRNDARARNPQRELTPNQNYSNQSEKWCKYCKHKGHEI